MKVLKILTIGNFHHSVLYDIMCSKCMNRITRIEKKHRKTQKEVHLQNDVLPEARDFCIRRFTIRTN